MLICVVFKDFDGYTSSQGRLVWKDFNIEDEALGAQKPVLKELFNVSVTKNILEIQFFWTGKGTTRIPNRGVYGPLISAISVTSSKSSVLVLKTVNIILTL